MTREHLPIAPHDGLGIDELNDVFSDTEPITLRCYRATNAAGRLPLVLYIHGGGFVTGGLETDDCMCREIALQAPVVLSVKYRLAAEHPFPAGFTDCLEAIKWVTSPDGQGKINADLSKGFVFGGTSAGGNFTSGLAHAMLEQGVTPQPTAYFSWHQASVIQTSDLQNTSIKYFAEKYGASPGDKRYSPLLYPSRKGLAQKVFIQICGWDPWRDEAILCRQPLEDDGIEARSKVYKSLPHSFWTTCSELPESKEAIMRDHQQRRSFKYGMTGILARMRPGK